MNLRWYMISLTGNARIFSQSNVNGDIESVWSWNLRSMLCNSFIWTKFNVESWTTSGKKERYIKEMQSIWQMEYLTNNNHTVVTCPDYYFSTTYTKHAYIAWYLINLSAYEIVFIQMNVFRQKKKEDCKIYKIIWIFHFIFDFIRWIVRVLNFHSLVIILFSFSNGKIAEHSVITTNDLMKINGRMNELWSKFVKSKWTTTKKKSISSS